jgi:hypothetical protein
VVFVPIRWFCSPRRASIAAGFYLPPSTKVLIRRLILRGKHIHPKVLIRRLILRGKHKTTFTSDSPVDSPRQTPYENFHANFDEKS